MRRIFLKRITAAALGAVLFCGLFFPLRAVELSKCVIYHAPDAPPSVKEAARELSDYLAKILGVKLKVQNEPGQPMIALGDTPQTQAARITDGKPLAYEEFVIRTHGGNLYIVGRDMPNDGKTEFYGDSFGTRYGVYDFLENVLGVRWLLPGERGIYLPKYPSDYRSGPLNIRFQPRFSSRKLVFNWPKNPAVHEWTKFNKMIPNAAFACGWRYLHNYHSWSVLFPLSETHFTAKYNKSALKTFREHPEYFGMSKAGKRISPVGQFSLCLSNVKLMDEMAERVKNSVRCQRDRFKGWDRYRYSCISPADAQPSCNCPECRRYVRPNDYSALGTVAYPGNVENWSELVFMYYRALCERLPDYILSGYVYYKSEFTYPGISPMPRNFLGIMAPLHTGYGPVRLYEPVNRAWHNWQKSWDGIFTEQFYYGVDFWLRQSVGAPMSPYPGLMKDTFETLVKRPYVGLQIYENKGYGHSGLYMWMMMKMEWNPYLDPYKLMDEYLNKAYGAATAPFMKKIYELAESGMKTFITRRKGKTGYNFSPELLKEVYADRWSEYEKLFLSAFAAPKDENQAWRFDLFRENLRFLRYHLESMKLIQGEAPAPLKMDESVIHGNILRSQRDPVFAVCVNGIAESSYLHNVVFSASARPVSIPSAEKQSDHNFYRYHQDIIVQSDHDGLGRMRLVYKTKPNPFTGRPYLPEIGYFNVYDMQGKHLFSGITRGGEIHFPVKKGKTYYLIKQGDLDYMSGCVWRIAETNLRYAFGQKIDPQGIAMAGFSGPLYFHVREGVPSFKFYLTSSVIDFELIDPAGKIVLSDSKSRNYRICTVKNAQPGWWKLKIRNSGGIDGYFRLGEELDPFVVMDPEKALFVQKE